VTVINDLLRPHNRGWINSLIVTTAPTYLGASGVAIAPFTKLRHSKELELNNAKWLHYSQDIAMTWTNQLDERTERFGGSPIQAVQNTIPRGDIIEPTPETFRNNLGNVFDGAKIGLGNGSGLFATPTPNCTQHSDSRQRYGSQVSPQSLPPLGLHHISPSTASSVSQRESNTSSAPNLSLDNGMSKLSLS
jgi:hypothetical protein